MYLIGYLSDELQYLVQGTDNLYDAWLKIKNHFERHEPISAQIIREKIAKGKFTDPKKVTETMKELDQLILQLQQKATLTDKEKLSIYVASLSKDYDGIYSTVTAMSAQLNPISLSTLNTMIINHARDRIGPLV